MRWSGLAALLGGLLCLLLTPIQASIFSGGESPPLVLASRPLQDLADTIHGTFGPRLGLDEYYFYGRMFFLVYLGAIAGLVGLHTLQSGGERRERTWFRVLLIALVLALVGDVVAYWGREWRYLGEPRARAWVHVRDAGSPCGADRLGALWQGDAARGRCSGLGRVATRDRWSRRRADGLPHQLYPPRGGTAVEPGDGGRGVRPPDAGQKGT